MTHAVGSPGDKEACILFTARPAELLLPPFAVSSFPKNDEDLDSHQRTIAFQRTVTLYHLKVLGCSTENG